MKQVIKLTEDGIQNWAPTPGATMQHLTVDGTARQFSALDSLTRYCIINVQGADVRVRIDGTAPVGGTTGLLLPAGTYIYWARLFVERAKFIKDSTGDAVLALQECVTAFSSATN
jgi:hypothetical protein